MKKILFLLVSAFFAVVILAQDRDEKKDDFVVKVVNDVMKVCEEGQDTTLERSVVASEDSVLSYVVRLAEGDSVMVDSLSVEDKTKLLDFVRVVASKTELDSAENKVVVTTVKSSKKSVTLNLDFDALDSLEFEIDLDDVSGDNEK